MHPKYVPASTILQRYRVSRSTVRRCVDSKSLPSVSLTPKGKRLYDLQALTRLLGDASQIKEEENGARMRIIYTRASSRQQHDDLQRQQSDLRDAYPNHRLISDIGFGLHFKRGRVCGNVGEANVLPRTLQVSRVVTGKGHRVSLGAADHHHRGIYQ